MRDLQQVLAACGELKLSGIRAALATVVEVEGSAYRRAGALLLVAEDGRTWGGISGGCLEADVILRAHQVIEEGAPALCCYDTRSDADLFFGLGLGCNGLIRVLIERIEEGDAPTLADMGRSLAQRETAVHAVVYASSNCEVALGARWALQCNGAAIDLAGAPPDLATALRAQMCRTLHDGRSKSMQLATSEGPVSVFIEVLRPTPSLAIFGAGFDAVPLVQGACELGWRVSVGDRRPACARSENFPGAYRVDLCDGPTAVSRAGLDNRSAALLMTHNYLDDRELLPLLLKSPAAFIGLLGPRRRTERLLRDLAKQGWEFSERELERLHAPVGLDIGAQTPEEIALAVLAEVQSAFSGRSGGFLRDRGAPIHEAANDG